MRAAELVALGAAHGIDLQHVAGSASDVQGAAAKRRRTKDERNNGMPIRDTVRAVGSRTYRRPVWSGADSGAFAQNVPRMPWLAVRYSFAGDETGYGEMHRALILQQMKIATRENWPLQVRMRDGRRDYYQGQLAALVLDVDRQKSLFDEAGALHNLRQDIPILHALCVGVSDDLWEHVVVRWYDTLRTEVYERWLGIGRSIIQGWINDAPQVVPRERVA